jgi:hypothetical protein
MITIIHNVSRVSSAGSSEELAEPHVNKTTRLATDDSEQPLGLGGSYGSTESPPTVYSTRDIDSHSSTITQEPARYQRSLRNGQKNRRRQQYVLSSSATVSHCHSFVYFVLVAFFWKSQARILSVGRVTSHSPGVITSAQKSLQPVRERIALPSIRHYRPQPIPTHGAAPHRERTELRSAAQCRRGARPSFPP